MRIHRSYTLPNTPRFVHHPLHTTSRTPLIVHNSSYTNFRVPPLVHHPSNRSYPKSETPRAAPLVHNPSHSGTLLAAVHASTNPRYTNTTNTNTPFNYYPPGLPTQQPLHPNDSYPTPNPHHCPPTYYHLAPSSATRSTRGPRLHRIPAMRARSPLTSPSLSPLTSAPHPTTPACPHPRAPTARVGGRPLGITRGGGGGG